MNKTLQKEINKQMQVIKQNTVEIIPEHGLRKKIEAALYNNKPLRIKQGIDPTSPDVHIGHMVPFRKMRQFQDLGHTGIIIIGDYTARIGDPSGQNRGRPALSAQQVKENAEKYTEQIFKIVNKQKTEVRFQSEWYFMFDLQEIIKVISHFSVAQLLAHETFRKRLDNGKRLSLHELIYPVLQAYDSVVIKADVEIGGTDQKFNMLCGRELMKQYKLQPQHIICMPLLTGTDGSKMSKSRGNHIAVFSSAQDKFGRIMSITDNLILDFYRYGTNLDSSELKIVERKLSNNEVNPKILKSQLARHIISIYHSQQEAKAAAGEFENVFVNKKQPQHIPELSTGEKQVWICQIMKQGNLVPSTSEAQRLIKQGAVCVNNKKIGDVNFQIELTGKQDVILKVGKRRFLKLIHKN